jgi:hypothetical protein
MSAFYENLKDIADSLISQFGFRVTLKKPLGAFDQFQGKRVYDDPEDPKWELFQGEAVQLDVDKTVRVDSSIGENSIVLLLVGTPKPSQVEDRMIVLGKEYVVSRVKDVSPGGVNLLYEVYLS